MNWKFFWSIITLGPVIQLSSSAPQFDFREAGGVPDAFVLVYSVIDKPSYHRVETDVIRLHEEGHLRTRPAIIVANKIDLARARAVPSQGWYFLIQKYGKLGQTRHFRKLWINLKLSRQWLKWKILSANNSPKKREEGKLGISLSTKKHHPPH